ncbi:MAG: twin-arginine translocase TatA/TatE family subunit [Nitrospirota bacterium]|jgi:sec-independent protein translocase protein TatA
MFGIGLPELLIIAGLVVLIFGARKLPQIGAGLGEGIQNFRKAMKGDHGDEEEDKELLEEEQRDGQGK